ncbi:MAG: hypothetical protein IKI11_03345 [Neisseriaceae bacterium]|nr:hypothetical protein [Neisseriaceae bacterium]
MSCKKNSRRVGILAHHCPVGANPTIYMFRLPERFSALLLYCYTPPERLSAFRRLPRFELHSNLAMTHTAVGWVSNPPRTP